MDIWCQRTSREIHHLSPVTPGVASWSPYPLRQLSKRALAARFFIANHMNWQRNRFFRLLRARPRLFIATAIAIAVGIVLPTSVARQPVTRWLIAWNVGAGLYVLLAAIMMVRSSSHHMRHRAQLQDDGQRTILALVVIATIARLAAIAGELSIVKDMHGFIKGAHIALAGATVLTSWAFIQVMFALHYAHDFYAAACHGRPPGLQFPEEAHPDY